MFYLIYSMIPYVDLAGWKYLLLKIWVSGDCVTKEN